MYQGVGCRNREWERSVNSPEHFTATVTRDAGEHPMRVEQLAMNVAMDHERAQGRSPEDVSKEGVACDILSGGRRIEVKGTSRGGIPDTAGNAFDEHLKFRADLLYVVDVIDRKAARLTIIPKKEIDRHQQRVLRNIRFASSLKTKLRNNLKTREFETHKVE